MIINKKIDDKKIGIAFKNIYKLGRKNLFKLPKISYTQAEKLTTTYMKIIRFVWNAGRTLAIGIVFLWYLPIKKDMGYDISVATFLFFIILHLWFGKTTTIKEE